MNIVSPKPARRADEGKHRRTRLRITLMLGGPSAEREVSLRSGKAVAAALRSLGHEVAELDPQTPDWELTRGTELVFLALHGTYGEDGTVQRRLEALGIPFTGCDSYSSAIAFDKARTKTKLIEQRVPTAGFVVLQSNTAPFPAGFQPPVVLKPLRQGSSVGLQFVERFEDWPAALAAALAHDSEALVEEKIVGREMTVAILDGRPLPIVEIRPKNGAYDYHNKYTVGATDYFCPAPLEPAVAREVSAAGLGAFQAIGGRDYARVDVMVRANGAPVVLEVNTLPGMTETSLFPKAAAAAGMSYPQLCQKMAELALARHSPRTS